MPPSPSSLLQQPSQEGIYRHFKTIAEAVDIPMIVYNVPGRTVVNMDNDTILRLAQIPNITGVKEASGALARETDLINRAPEGFAVYSGDDPTALPFLLCGGHGVISVAANAAPKLFADMCRAALAGDIPLARELNRRLTPLYDRHVLRTQPRRPKMGRRPTGHVFRTRPPAHPPPYPGRTSQSARRTYPNRPDLIHTESA